jgi:Flp pilus assembly protein TadG
LYFRRCLNAKLKVFRNRFELSSTDQEGPLKELVTLCEVDVAAPCAYRRDESGRAARASGLCNWSLDCPRRIRSIIRRRYSALAGCRRGVAALEFALIAGPLLAIMFGMIAASAVFLVSSMMQGSAQYGARVMATGQVKNNTAGVITSNVPVTTPCSSTLTATQVEYYACSNLPKWATFSVTTTESCSTTSISTVTVSLSTNLSSAAIMDVFRFFVGKTLTTTAVVMKEGQCP